MSHRPIVFATTLCLWAAASCTRLNPASQDAGTGGASLPDSSTDHAEVSGNGGMRGAGGAGVGGAGVGGAGTGGAGMAGAGMGGAGVGGAGGSSAAAGCALIMHMDEVSWNGSSGEVIDSCHHNNGTAVRVVSAADALPNTTNGGKYGGRAGMFIDSGGCVEVSDDSSLHATTQLTVAAWIFPTGFNPLSNGIVGKRADYLSDSSYTLFVWNNLDVNYHLYADIGNDRFNGSQTLNANFWYHVALVFDGTLPAAQRVRLYVNGSLDGEFNETATSVPVFQTPVHVGCMPAGTPPSAGQEFIGKLDEVAIWTRALGAAELMQLALSTTPL